MLPVDLSLLDQEVPVLLQWQVLDLQCAINDLELRFCDLT